MKVSESEWLTLTLVVEKEGYKQASKQTALMVTKQTFIVLNTTYILIAILIHM